MSVVECLLRVYHYHTSIYRLEGKLRVRSFISLLEKNGGFQKMTWEFLWKTFFDFMTSIGRSGVASKRFLYEWHMRNNSNWFLGRRSFVPQTPFFCNDCYLTIISEKLLCMPASRNISCFTKLILNIPANFEWTQNNV